MPLNPSGCELKEWPARFLSVTRLLTFLVCLVAVSEVWGSDSKSEDLTELSAKEAVSLLCSQQVTAVTYAKALLARGKEIDCLNSCAFTSESTVIAAAEAVDAKAAAGEDVRPLCGLAFAVKDNIDVEGYPTAAGTPTLEEYVLDRSSPLIKRLEEANGVVLAKTRMHELAEGVTSISPYYGAVLNPYKVDTHVGGSSGGTAALVAARGVTAGFCSDTGGSCRIPASLTGVVGFRPTSSGKNRQQCYNTGGGIVPISTTRDTAGLIARNVEDIQFLDTLFNDCPRVEKDVALKGLRVGLPLNWWLDIGAEVQSSS